MSIVDASALDALLEPLEPHLVKTRSGPGGRPLSYITARTAMQRLDAVVGPEHWRDTYRPWGQDALICRVEIKIGEEWIGKEGVGGKAEMTTADDSDKSAESHAFKRACVKWGVGRYLYGDDQPFYPARDQSNRPGDYRNIPDRPSGDQTPTTGKGLFRVLKDLEAKHEVSLVRMVNDWAKDRGINGRMIDWDRATVSDAWIVVSGHLEGIQKFGREPGQEG